MLTLKWDIFTGFKRLNDVRRAEADREVARAELMTLEVEAISQVWRAYHEFESSLSKYEYAESLLAASEESYDANLENIRPGMSAEVYLLSYPNRRFHGRVQGVGWALYQDNGATVAGLPQVEPTLNWVRLSQRFPVRIILEDSDPAFPFHGNATAVVTIQGNR